MRYNLTSAFQNILTFQSAFKPTLSIFRAMSSLPTNQDASRVLDYWFANPGPESIKKWFRDGPAYDEEIKSQFSSLVTQARSSKLDSWKEKPESTLALVILLDQFPRNIFRGSPESFASDARALNVSIEALAKGFDRQVTETQQGFFYLPFMHAEDLGMQVANMAFLELLNKRCEEESFERMFASHSLKAAESHRDVIANFGRFPSRNKILGRESTEQELHFLREHPSGF